MSLSSHRSRVALVAALLIAAAALALVAVHVPPRPYSARATGAPAQGRLPSTTVTAGAAAPTAKSGQRKPPDLSGFAWLDVVVAIAVGFVTLVSLIGLVLFLVASLRRVSEVRLGLRHRTRSADSAPPRAERDGPDEMARVIDAGLAELATGEPDDAIIACWLRLSDEARDAGVEGRRADTAGDLVARLTGRGLVRSEAIERLAALYREARFSKHPMSEADRADARAALETVRAELRAGAHV